MTIAVVKSGAFTGVTYEDLELKQSIFDDHTTNGETLVYLESAISNGGTDAVPVYRTPTAGETASTIGLNDLPSTFSVTENTKLAGIEDNATADQSNAEVKAAYEANSNTNAYTDAEQTKVGHIAVTQAVDLDAIESDLAGKQDALTAGDHITITSGSSADITVTSNDGPVFTGQLLGTSSGSSWGRVDINNFPNIRFSESFVVGQTYRFEDNSGDIWEFELGSINAGGLTQSYIQLIPATEPVVNPDGAATTGHLQDFSDITTLWTGSGNITKVTGGGSNEVSVDTTDFSMAADLASTDNAKGASLIGLEDSAGNFASDDLEAALAEMFTGNKFKASLLPSYVDDVEEYANFASLPGTGEAGKLYVTLDDNSLYRWSGSVYVGISDVLSASEIESLYEGLVNTNKFTDADHSKLDSIETGATADQTEAEIVALYEGASDRNQYSDAEKAKLANLSNNPAGDYQRIVANPTITSATTIPTFTNGGTVSYQVQSSDPQSLFKIIDDDGTGITINAETGTMFGGSGASAGSYTLVVVTASVFGVSAETNLTLTIS